MHANRSSARSVSEQTSTLIESWPDRDTHNAAADDAADLIRRPEGGISEGNWWAAC